MTKLLSCGEAVLFDRGPGERGIQPQHAAIMPSPCDIAQPMTMGGSSACDVSTWCASGEGCDVSSLMPV